MTAHPANVPHDRPHPPVVLGRFSDSETNLVSESSKTVVAVLDLRAER
jgi:hypothetical protein